MKIIEYGTHQIDPATLPETSIDALLRRGVSHFLGNEQASKLTAWVEAQAKLDPPVTPSDEAKASRKAELVAEAIAALAAGTIGTRVAGPKVSPIESVMRGIAKQEVTDTLRANKLSFPTGDKVVVFPNGDKFDGKTLVDRRLAKHGERIRKEAEAEMRRRAKAAEKNAANGLEDLA